MRFLAPLCILGALAAQGGSAHRNPNVPQVQAKRGQYDYAVNTPSANDATSTLIFPEGNPSYPPSGPTSTDTPPPSTSEVGYGDVPPDSIIYNTPTENIVYETPTESIVYETPIDSSTPNLVGRPPHTQIITASGSCGPAKTVIVTEVVTSWLKGDSKPCYPKTETITKYPGYGGHTVTVTSTKYIPKPTTVTITEGGHYETVTVTQTGHGSKHTVTITEGGHNETVTVTQSGHGSTETVTVAGPLTTVVLPGTTVVQEGSTIVLPGTTVVQEGSTIVLPGSTVTKEGPTVTQVGTKYITQPGTTEVVTISGQRTTIQLPGSTLTQVYTEVGPGTTVTQVGTRYVTQPATTKVVTISGERTTIELPGSTMTQVYTETAPGKTVVTTISGEGRTLTLSGERTVVTNVVTQVVTVTLPVQSTTITLPPETRTLTISGEKTTITLPGTTSVITLPEQTITRPGPTITAPGQTEIITAPGQTIVQTITREVPPQTVTITQQGQTITSVLPGTTNIITTTLTLGPVTYTPPATTVTRTEISTISLCPAVTGSSAPLEVDSQLTWGCGPGFVCNPPKPGGCNFWPEPPKDDYLCEPKYCELAPSFKNVTWKTNHTGYYPPTSGFFNLNPEAFGLTYGIFEKEVIQKIDKHGKVKTITTGTWESQTSLSDWPKTTTTAAPKLRLRERSLHTFSKRDGVTPALCYNICNNAFTIAQSIGKTDDLCEDGSDFKTTYDKCAECIQKKKGNEKVTIKDYVEPEFEQFIDYCTGRDPSSASSDARVESQVVSQAEETTKAQASATSGGFAALSTSKTSTKQADAKADNLESQIASSTAEEASATSDSAETSEGEQTFTILPASETNVSGSEEATATRGRSGSTTITATETAAAQSTSSSGSGGGGGGGGGGSGSDSSDSGSSSVATRTSSGSEGTSTPSTVTGSASRLTAGFASFITLLVSLTVIFI